MMYWCWNCERHFEEPLERETTQARLFGVEAMPTDERITIHLCPYCKSEEIEKEKEEDEE